jgi:hypothetical protein
MARRHSNAVQGPSEAALLRVIDLTAVVIGWLYLFGGRSGATHIVAASVIDRLIFVPLLLLPLAIAGAFLHCSSPSPFSTCRSR